MFTRFAAALAVLAMPLAAQAGEFNQTTVRYGDLDLSSPSGMAELQTRLARAANKVCAIEDMRDAAGVGRAMKCRRAALARASGQAQLALAKQQSRQAMTASTARPTS